ncbi:MAG: glycosyltransferase family 39 protein, partial [Acidobacteriota bacterium]
MASLTRKIGSRTAASWALWIVVATPTALHLATTAGNDLVVTMFCAGAWLGLIHTAGDTENPMRWWLFAGACVGLAMGTKYTAMGTVAIPLAVGAIVLHRPWKGADQFTGLLRGSSAAMAAALAIFAPWAVRNFADTGNPLFPFLNSLFRGSLKVSLDRAQEFDSWISGFDLSARHLVSGFDLGTFQAPLDGFPSIGLAYLPLAALAIVVFVLKRPRNNEVPALAAGTVAGITFWLASLHVDRYLLAALVPAIPVLAIALAATLEMASKVVRTALVALLALIIAWNLAASASQMGLERLGCALGVEEVEPILAHWVSSSPAFEPVAALPSDAKLLLVAEARALGFERPVELEHPFGEPRLEELARTSPNPRAMAAT